MIFWREGTMHNENGNTLCNHILTASSNLLGICFVLVSIIRISGLNHKTLLDEITSIAIVLFLASSILSYASIRSVDHQVSYEKAADTIFITGLTFLSLVSIVVMFGFIM
jgi:hypothetical protein